MIRSGLLLLLSLALGAHGLRSDGDDDSANLHVKSEEQRDVVEQLNLLGRKVAFKSQAGWSLKNANGVLKLSDRKPNIKYRWKPNVLWHITRASGGYYYIRSDASNQHYLSTNEEHQADLDFYRGDNEQWTITDAGDGNVFIANQLGKRLVARTDLLSGVVQLAWSSEGHQSWYKWKVSKMKNDHLEPEVDPSEPEVDPLESEVDDVLVDDVSDFKDPGDRATFLLFKNAGRCLQWLSDHFEYYRVNTKSGTDQEILAKCSTLFEGVPVTGGLQIRSITEGVCFAVLVPDGSDKAATSVETLADCTSSAHLTVFVPSADDDNVLCPAGDDLGGNMCVARRFVHA